MLSMAEVQNCAAICAVGRLLDHFKCRQWAPKNLETHPSDCCKAEKRAIQSSQFKKGSFIHKKILGPKSLKGSVHRMHRIGPTYNGMAQTDCLCHNHVELWIIMVSVWTWGIRSFELPDFHEWAIQPIKIAVLLSNFFDSTQSHHSTDVP